MVYDPFNVLLDLVSQYFVDELFFLREEDFRKITAILLSKL